MESRTTQPIQAAYVPDTFGDAWRTSPSQALRTRKADLGQRAKVGKGKTASPPKPPVRAVASPAGTFAQIRIRSISPRVSWSLVRL